MNYLVLGGTGTLGSTLIKNLAKASSNKIICFSRDELKQQSLKALYPDVKFILGDIRDKDAVEFSMRGIDVVFHTAALKHVDLLEKNPMEAFKTNVTGTANAAEAAVRHGVSSFIFSSTDKAVLPINAYGFSKAMAERYLFDLNEKQYKTRFFVYRWGNVIGSRGSVIHSFLKTLKERGEVDITHADMTRFWIKIDTAVKFMLTSYLNADPMIPQIPPMKSSTVVSLAETLAAEMGLQAKVNLIGIRPGEKLHECIFSSAMSCVRSDNSLRYSDDELKDLVRGVL